MFTTYGQYIDRNVENKENIERLFKLYLEGLTDAKQEEILFRHLGEDDRLDKELDLFMRKSWHDEPSQRDESAATNASLEHIHNEIKRRNKRPDHWKLVFRYAAAAVFILGMAFGWLMYIKPPSEQNEVVKLVSKTTLLGEKVKITLPDSTMVFLAENSTLTWPVYFVEKGERRIILKGEAFFDVKRDVSRPFIIYSGALKTRVLGTAFNVRAYDDADEIAVTVMRGRVAVYPVSTADHHTSFADAIEVNPKQRAIFNKMNRSLSLMAEPNADLLLARIEGVLKYNGVSLKRIISEMSRQYNKDIKLSGPIENCVYYGEFQLSDKLEDALKQICLTIGGTLLEENGKYVISGTGC